MDLDKLGIEDDLLQIEDLRHKMVSTALQYGFHHELVLEYSQRIDRMHNMILNKQKSKAKQLAIK